MKYTFTGTVCVFTCGDNINYICLSAIRYDMCFIWQHTHYNLYWTILKQVYCDNELFTNWHKQWQFYIHSTKYFSC